MNEEDLEYMSQLDNMRAQFHAAAAIDGLDDVEDEDDFSSNLTRLTPSNLQRGCPRKSSMCPDEFNAFS